MVVGSKEKVLYGKRAAVFCEDVVLHGGVHFRKGCYPGQEIIARAQYRGQVKRGLAVADNAVPPPAGAPVQDAQQAEAGIVMNQSGSLHLLVVNHGAGQPGFFAKKGSPVAVQILHIATDNHPAKLLNFRMHPN